MKNHDHTYQAPHHFAGVVIYPCRYSGQILVVFPNGETERGRIVFVTSHDEYDDSYFTAGVCQSADRTKLLWTNTEGNVLLSTPLNTPAEERERAPTA